MTWADFITEGLRRAGNPQDCPLYEWVSDKDMLLMQVDEAFQVIEATPFKTPNEPLGFDADWVYWIIYFMHDLLSEYAKTMLFEKLRPTPRNEFETVLLERRLGLLAMLDNQIDFTDPRNEAYEHLRPLVEESREFWYPRFPAVRRIIEARYGDSDN